MILGYRNLLLAWLDHTDAANRGVWRTRMRAADVVGGVEYSFVDASDFGPEPARQKAWSEVAVETKFGGVGSVRLLPVDGGLSWTNLPSLGETASGILYITRFKVAPSGQPRRGGGTLLTPNAQDCRERLLPSGSWNHATRAPPGAVQMPRSSWTMPS